MRAGPSNVNRVNARRNEIEVLSITSWCDGPPAARLCARFVGSVLLQNGLRQDYAYGCLCRMHRLAANRPEMPKTRPGGRALAPAACASPVELETVTVEVKPRGTSIVQDAGIKLWIDEFLDGTTFAADEMMVVVAL